jgi:hypothetical protein
MPISSRISDGDGGDGDRDVLDCLFAFVRRDDDDVAFAICVSPINFPCHVRESCARRH